MYGIIYLEVAKMEGLPKRCCYLILKTSLFAGKVS